MQTFLTKKICFDKLILLYQIEGFGPGFKFSGYVLEKIKTI